MDYETILLQITDVLKEHNHPGARLSDQEAVERIAEIIIKSLQEDF